MGLPSDEMMAEAERLTQLQEEEEVLVAKALEDQRRQCAEDLRARLVEGRTAAAAAQERLCEAREAAAAIEEVNARRRSKERAELAEAARLVEEKEREKAIARAERKASRERAERASLKERMALEKEAAAEAERLAAQEQAEQEWRAAVANKLSFQDEGKEEEREEALGPGIGEGDQEEEEQGDEATSTKLKRPEAPTFLIRPEERTMVAQGASSLEEILALHEVNLSQEQEVTKWAEYLKALRGQLGGPPLHPFRISLLVGDQEEKEHATSAIEQLLQDRHAWWRHRQQVPSLASTPGKATQDQSYAETLEKLRQSVSVKAVEVEQQSKAPRHRKA
mmetsp:Transcript_41058/g.92440  ORF Transcript_41058/g.92440 Transcript_41058/m.92440 type:complete len:337 (+) Transcript_41058:1467-2477(+)